MCSFAIVAVTPVLRDRADIFQGGKEPSIKHPVSWVSVQTIEIGILVRLVGFDEGEDDTPRRAPRPQGIGDEVRLIVALQPPRYAITGH